MERVYYAKSDNGETIKEHTDNLLQNLEILKKNYRDEILNSKIDDKDRFFYLLEIVCKYHDIGKVFTPFQNIIFKKMNKQIIPTKFNYNIKHEQLSPMFVPAEELGLTSEERKLIFQSIYYHHERENKEIDNKLVSEIIEEDIKPQLENIKNQVKFEINENLTPIYIRYIKRRIKDGDKLYNEYCLLKGLLHRLDHSSSALIDVEETTDESIADFTEISMKNANYNLNELQNFSKNNQDKNILVIGSTGIGKTEASLLWSNNEKTFFTLPIRISINAIYDRIYDNINYKHVGLLHSTAVDYLESKQEFENEPMIYNQTKNLFSKITTCTIDQIFPFVFKYKGYEKIYATLAYSKIIIDEIQAYSPEIVAIILKGIQMINSIGGKFMIMTATLPRIYKEELYKMGIEFEYNEFIKPIKRHRIKIEEEALENALETIKVKSDKSKVLIIVNTVDKAIELYTKLKLIDCNNVNLLHSRFILNDRAKKENDIKEFSKKLEKSGVWITTQIVEASLDIDFDYLYTEMSTLDSLFQRLGRCYRSRLYIGETPNVYIYTKDVSGIGDKGVYNTQIFNSSIELLKEYNNTILEEQEKIDLVDKLYSNEMLKDTQFLRDFKAGIQVLNNIIDYDVSKSDAQKLLRNIENVTVIPKNIYEENIDLFDKYEETQDYKMKNKIRREIAKFTTSISRFKANKLKSYLCTIPYFDNKDILIIDMPYNNEQGLMFEETQEDNWDKRNL